MPEEDEINSKIIILKNYVLKKGQRNGPIKNRRLIDERPKIIDEKGRIGDWEIDTIIGKHRKQAVISIVGRRKIYRRQLKLESKLLLELIRQSFLMEKMLSILQSW